MTYLVSNNTKTFTSKVEKSCLRFVHNMKSTYNAINFRVFFDVITFKNSLLNVLVVILCILCYVAYLYMQFSEIESDDSSIVEPTTDPMSASVESKDITKATSEKFDAKLAELSNSNVVGENISEESNTETQKHRNTETQKHRNTETQRVKLI